MLIFVVIIAVIFIVGGGIFFFSKSSSETSEEQKPYTLLNKEQPIMVSKVLNTIEQQNIPSTDSKGSDKLITNQKNQNVLDQNLIPFFRNTTKIISQQIKNENT